MEGKVNGKENVYKKQRKEEANMGNMEGEGRIIGEFNKAKENERERRKRRLRGGKMGGVHGREVESRGKEGGWENEE